LEAWTSEWPYRSQQILVAGPLWTVCEKWNAPGFVTTSTGLEYRDVIVGTGAMPSGEAAIVTVNFTAPHLMSVPRLRNYKRSRHPPSRRRLAENEGRDSVARGGVEPPTFRFSGARPPCHSVPTCPNLTPSCEGQSRSDQNEPKSNVIAV
jgi:hypothetical protein